MFSIFVSVKTNIFPLQSYFELDSNHLNIITAMKVSVACLLVLVILQLKGIQLLPSESLLICITIAGYNEQMYDHV